MSWNDDDMTTIRWNAYAILTVIGICVAGMFAQLHFFPADECCNCCVTDIPQRMKP